MSSPLTARAARLGRDQRRDGLLDVAVAIAEESSVDDVTMDAVAARADVSRPLLYKHFANRGELLGAMYRREAEILHRQLASRVAAATDLESMFEELVTGAIEASRDRGAMFAALRSAGGWTRDIRREQRTRDLATSRAFMSTAKREGIDGAKAGPATAMLLSLVDSVVAQYRAKPSSERAALLCDTYLTIVRSTLAALRR